MPAIPVPVVARAHGLFNIVGGLWPLLHVRSFEAVFGQKADRFLEYTVAGLMVCVGWSQLTSSRSPEGAAHARTVGIGTAGTLLAIDLIYAPPRRIPATYLLDAALEAGWLAAWALADPDT